MRAAHGRWPLLLFFWTLGLASSALDTAEARAGEKAESFAGQFLVASERMGDPRFDQTIVYMVEHNEEGAMGLIVNVPMGEVPFEALFERLGIDDRKAKGGISVFYGGPVDPGRGFFLHSTDVMIEGSQTVGKDVALTTVPGMLSVVSQGKGPAHSVFALGYAGWAPKQLESELARDDWFVIPADKSLLFAEDPTKSWTRAAARRGTDL
jgi:putative transcriptional regulator